MSHVRTNKNRVIVTCLESLMRAVAKFPKLHWKPHQKTWKWYGTWVKDYNQSDAAYKNGIDPSQYGFGEHAITVDGSGYEIGVVKRKDGKGYSLVWDFYGTGKQIDAVIGKSGEKLLVEYQKSFLQKFSLEQGLTFEGEANENEINIEMVEQNV